MAPPRGGGIVRGTAPAPAGALVPATEPAPDAAAPHEPGPPAPDTLDDTGSTPDSAADAGRDDEPGDLNEIDPDDGAAAETGEAGGDAETTRAHPSAGTARGSARVRAPRISASATVQPKPDPGSAPTADPTAESTDPTADQASGTDAASAEPATDRATSPDTGRAADPDTGRAADPPAAAGPAATVGTTGSAGPVETAHTTGSAGTTGSAAPVATAEPVATVDPTETTDAAESAGAAGPAGPTASTGAAGRTDGDAALAGRSAMPPRQSRSGPPVEGLADPAIEPTTGAPVGTLPSRAPVRQPQGGWPSPAGTGRPLADPVAPVEGVDEPAFWLPIEQVHWDGRPVRQEREGWIARWRTARAATHRVAQPPPPPRRPAVGLAGLLLFALAASFFASVSAQPLWLATGHGQRGVVIVSSCSGSGVRLACAGRFSAAAGWTSPLLPVVGVGAGAREPGSRVPARMVSVDAGKAYAENGAVARHLRWLLGLATALGCGPGIVWVTGARRLPEPRGRRSATLTALAIPVLLIAGFLAASF